jgi:beta-carotene/zeaxanthin 4-ketolase
MEIDRECWMETESPLQSQAPTPQSASLWGCLLTIGIVGAWLSTLAILLPRSIGTMPIGWVIGTIAGRTFLHTGLFILAHDAMHRNLIPPHKALNQRIGQLCVGLYAFLSYDQCCRNHGQHHKIPAQVGDPDFHDGIHGDPIRWYWHFLRGYLSLPGFGRFTLGWSGILLGGSLAQIALPNILLFWALPLILSSVQLFIFGTYLPHRNGLTDRRREHEQNYVQILASLLSCYHFGNYHWEHHTYPQIPWYRLPHIQPPRAKS